MKIPKFVLQNHEWSNPEYQYTPVQLLGFTLYYKLPIKFKDTDSKKALLDLGFSVKDDIYDSRFYECELPAGWTYKESGYWTDYFDASGVKRLSQFDKWCSYDSTHFLNILA